MMRLYSGAVHKMADTGYSATVGLPNAQQHKDSWRTNSKIKDNFLEYKVLGGLKLTVLRAVSPLKFIGVNLTFELNCID